MTFPTIILEAGFGGTPASTYLQFDDVTRGLFDTGTFAPTGDGYIDLSAQGRSFTTSRGRNHDLEEYQAGRATVTFGDPADDLNPLNLSGPYVSAGVTEVQPMVPIRIRATVNGTTYAVWQGFADSWTNDYAGLGSDTTATVEATDAFKALSLFEPAGPQVVAGDAETAGPRIGRVLDNVGWSATDRDLDTGQGSLQGTDLSMNALREIQGVAQSEQGYFFISADGKTTFRDRLSRITDTRSSTAQAAFGNHSGLLAYSDIGLAYDDSLVKNVISAQIINGETQSVQDSASISSYLRHTYNTTGLWLNRDSDAFHWCQWIAEQYLEPELRIESITVLPQSDDALWPVVLGLEIGDLVTVSHITKGGFTIDRSLFVEGISHSTTASPQKWTTKLSFSSATVLQSGAWLILDDATLGKLDTGAFTF